jgi:hypothetical protein
MIRYLHMQAQPIVQHVAAKMYNTRNYSFLPNETVPLLNEDVDYLHHHPYYVPKHYMAYGVPIGIAAFVQQGQYHEVAQRN